MKRLEDDDLRESFAQMIRAAREELAASQKEENSNTKQMSAEELGWSFCVLSFSGDIFTCTM